RGRHAEDSRGRRHRGSRHGDDRLVQLYVPGRALEQGVAEGEDAAVGRHQPVAAAVVGRSHAHDRLVQLDVARAAEEPAVAEGEDPPVGRHVPVPLAVRSVGHADDGLVEGDVPGRAEELGVLAEVEYAAVGGGHAVARGGDGGGTRGRGGEGELDRSGTGAAEWWWPVEPWSHGIGTAGRLTHGRRGEGVDGRRPGTGG